MSLLAVVGADRELKTSVLKLLIEAAKHLGDPYVNSSTVYEPEYFLEWNQAGLDLVEQAKALLTA